MKKFLLILCIVFFGLPVVSSATPIVFTMDTEFDTLATVDFGTVTVQDLGSDLELTVALNTPQLGSNADLKNFYYNLVVGFTPTAQSHGFSLDLLWSGLRPGCRTTKSRRSRSESAKLSGATGLPVALHWCCGDRERCRRFSIRLCEQRQ